MSLPDAMREAVAGLDEQQQYLFALVTFCRTFAAIEQYDAGRPYLWPFRPILSARSADLLPELPVYRRQFKALDELSRADLGEGDSPRWLANTLANVGYHLSLAGTALLTAHWVAEAAGRSAQLMACLYVRETAAADEKRFQLGLLREPSVVRRYDDYTANERQALLVPDHGPVTDCEVEQD